MLGAKYDSYQYGGAGIVMLGIFCVLVPTFFGAPDTTPANTGTTTTFIPRYFNDPTNNDPYPMDMGMGMDMDMGLETGSATTSEGASSASTVKVGSSQGFWIAVQIFSIVPGVFSSVYKEKALGTVDIDVTYLNGWVAIFQLLCALPLAVPSAWASGLTIKELPHNLHMGMQCVMGHSSTQILESDDTSPSDDGFFFDEKIYHDCSMVSE